MKYSGHCHEKGRADRDKWYCPKVHVVNGQWVCDCEKPCGTAKKGRTTYTYENMDFRMFPGIQHDSIEWIKLYKIRTIVEWVINHFKINMSIAGRKTRNHVTTKADVFLAEIASQLTVVVAYRMSCSQYIRSLKSLIARKVFNFHNSLGTLIKVRQNLMFLVNLQMILHIDLFFLLI